MKNFDFKFYARTQTTVLFSMLVCNHGNVFAQVKAQANNAPDNADTKYNVLFIVADDLNCDMGCFDDPIVKTPNLDKLRQHAVRFNNSYCQYPFSGPSRASFLTGYSPNRTGVIDLQANFRDNLPAAVTLPELYKKNGYFTARVGKVFHAGVPNDIGKAGKDDPQSWVDTFNPIGVDKTEEDKVINYTPQRPLGSALSFMITNGSDDEHTDAIGANIACSMIKENKNKPFFIAMGFYRPHSPYVAPKKYFDLYPIEQITLPEVPENDWENRPIYERFTDPINWGVAEDKLKEAKRAYYATISFMDAQIGKLLTTLEKEGLINKTIVVFCSDNGYNLGQHGMWMKQALFEHTTRTPLIISVPGITNKEAKSSRIVEMLDIYPTLANLCELKHIPQDLDGRNLMPLLKDVNAQWDDVATSLVVRTGNPSIKYMKKGEKVIGKSIRVERYRYTEWDNGEKGGELYDYQVDPNENNNLYNNPKYRKIQEELKLGLRSKMPQ